MFTALIAIATALTATAYFVKRATIGIAAAFAWVLLAFDSYSLATNKNFGDIYFLIMWFAIGMMLAIFLEAIYMKFGVAGSSYIPTNDYEEKQESKRSKHDEVMDELKERRRRAKDLSDI